MSKNKHQYIKIGKKQMDRLSKISDLIDSIPEISRQGDEDLLKEKIKELLEDDLDLFDEVIMEIRKEKIEKIRNK